jgi:hypothetical protein
MTTRQRFVVSALAILLPFYDVNTYTKVHVHFGAHYEPFFTFN